MLRKAILRALDNGEPVLPGRLEYNFKDSKLPNAMRVAKVDGEVLLNGKTVKVGDIIRSGDKLEPVTSDAAIHGENVWIAVETGETEEQMPSTEEQERELRARVASLKDEISNLYSAAEKLFRTSGWIRTETEPPPVGVKVLGTRFGLFGWYERYRGKWHHDYMNGRSVEESGGPEFWMVLPPTPETPTTRKPE